MTADNGTKEIFNYGGGKPLELPGKSKKHAAESAREKLLRTAMPDSS